MKNKDWDELLDNNIHQNECSAIKALNRNSSIKRIASGNNIIHGDQTKRRQCLILNLKTV